MASDQPFLIFIEMTVQGITDPIRLVRDNKDQTWNGYLWQRFPVEFDKITEDGKELPAIALKVSNVDGIIQAYVQQYNGFGDAPVRIMVAHAAHLDNPIPEFELDVVITQTGYDEEWVTFTVGASGDHSNRFPLWRYLKSFCEYHFKDIVCGYVGPAAACDNTYATCRIKNRFGGEMGIESGS
jgi:phage-related protein